jgi:osmotically-inducible protein OsmY
MKTRFFVTFATVLAVMPVAAAAGQHVPLGDPQIKAQVEHRLADRDLRGVSVAVQQRVVTLSGDVASLWAKEEAMERARETDDVLAVVSELTIRRAESDRALGDAVAEKLRRYVFFSIFDDVGVEVREGAATLTGYVTMPYKAQAMARLAARVEGVQAVVNRIETLPVSSFDDQIRHEVAVRIYTDPLFWNYAIQVNPPVHVIVRHSRVTLTGVVASEVERRKAEVIARAVFGVLGVENELRLDD